jgi:hypothetical protein
MNLTKTPHINWVGSVFVDLIFYDNATIKGKF